MSAFEVIPGEKVTISDAKPAPGPRSIADRLMARTVDKLRDQHETFPVPARADDGIAVAYQAYMSREQVDAITAAFPGHPAQQEIELLVRQCKGLVIDGELHRGDDGAALTFTSKALQDMMGAVGPHDAVKSLYLREGDITRAAASVYALTGWRAAGVPLDPTRG